MARDGEGGSLFYFIWFRSERITCQSSLPMRPHYVRRESPAVSSTLLSSLPDSPLLRSVAPPEPRLLFICGVLMVGVRTEDTAAWRAWDFSASLGSESSVSLTQLLPTECLLRG